MICEITSIIFSTKKNRSPCAKKGHGSGRHRKSKDNDSHKRNDSNERKANKSPKYHEKSRSRSMSRETDIAYEESIARRNKDNDHDLSGTRGGLSCSWRNRIHHMINNDRKSNNGTSR